MGSRMKLKYTRAIIDAIHSGELSQAETAETAIFKLQVCVRHQPCYSWWACRRSSTAFYPHSLVQTGSWLLATLLTAK